MFTSLKAYRKSAHELQERHQWRMGFLAVLDRRLFPNLPPVAMGASGSESFNRGQRAALDCPMAVSVPAAEVSEYKADDQYEFAAFVSAAVVILGLIWLWVVSV